MRNFDVKSVIKALKHHMEWRQTNMPLPTLTDETLKLLNMGMIYIHGRSKDLCPIIIIDFKLLAENLKKKLIDNHRFTRLHNFYAHYVMHNMFVPGQTEKWLTFININKFSLSDMPTDFFKTCTRELSNNMIENT